MTVSLNRTLFSMVNKASRIIIFIVAMGLLTMISCGVKMSPADNPPLLKVSAENLEGLDQKQWSDIKEIAGKKVRTILGNETALFTLPAWWGNSARPKAGEIFVMEIDYKDVVPDLFIVSSFGNCANSVKYNSVTHLAANELEIGQKLSSLSELHRIAGENTSTWKTALVPVSWDYLYAGKGNPTGIGKQEFSIRLGNDGNNLPISEIRIRKATKDDEVRYNAETREWIKRDQQKYYTNDNPTVAQLPDIWKSKEVVPYLRNYLIPILPSDTPDKE